MWHKFECRMWIPGVSARMLKHIYVQAVKWIWVQDVTHIWVQDVKWIWVQDVTQIWVQDVKWIWVQDVTQIWVQDVKSRRECQNTKTHLRAGCDENHYSASLKALKHVGYTHIHTQLSLCSVWLDTLVGGEGGGGIFWSPVSLIGYTLGGGAFRFPVNLIGYRWKT